MLSSIDQFLAEAAAGEDIAWRPNWPHELGQKVGERILYHGLAGLLWESLTFRNWPDELVTRVKTQAQAQAMWELRHHAFVAQVITGLASKGVESVLLKGTAIAYDVYWKAYVRTRGDTDLLIAATDLDLARDVLAALGLQRQGAGTPNRFDLQEEWCLEAEEGAKQSIDLHWQVMNSPALSTVLTASDCFSDRLAIPAVCPTAFAMQRSLTLIHTCLHRAMHIRTPYFVGGQTYYGGDRLIWLVDIERLTAKMSLNDWKAFISTANERHVAEVCRLALEAARETLKVDIPDWVIRSLEPTPAEHGSDYLLRFGQVRRAIADVLALSGVSNKLDYVGSRVLPSEQFIRAKYPGEAHSLPILYLKRARDFLGFRGKSA